MKQTIYVLRGYPCSGKTTKTKEMIANRAKFNLESDYPINYLIRVSDSDIREMLCARNVLYVERVVSTILAGSINAVLQEGFDVIVDACNLSKYDMKFYYALAFTYNAELEVINLETSLQECIKRDSLREKPIGCVMIQEIIKREIELNAEFDEEIQDN